jgi:chromosome segregation ATPase
MTQALHQEEIRIVSEAKELDQGELELKRWRQEIETLRFEESQLAEERGEVQTQTHQNEIALQEAEQEKRNREDGLIQREQDLQTLKGDIEGLVADLTEAKLRVAGAKRSRIASAR